MEHVMGRGYSIPNRIDYLIHVKKRIDLHFARKTAKNTIYKVKIVEGHVDIDHGDVVTHPKKW